MAWAEMLKPRKVGRPTQLPATGEIADEQYEHVIAYLGEELRRATSGEAPEQERLF